MRRARHIAGNAEYYLEYEWANKIVSNTHPLEVLSRFPYMDCYKSLADTEIAQLQLHAPRARRILFVGGGPLPLSAILFADAGYSVTAIDYNLEAVLLSRRLIQRLGYDVKIKTDLSSAEEFSTYHEYDAIVLGALVGESAQEKERLILDVVKRSRKNVPILCRSVDGLSEFLYSGVPYVDGEIARVPAVQGKHINSLVICLGGMLNLEAQNKVNRLLNLYEIYKRLKNVEDKSLRDSLSDIMRFDTPIVWVGYKTLAYRGTKNEIKTIADLKAHCSDPDDICAKRFRYISNIVNAVGDSSPISVLWEEPAIFAKLSTQDVLAGWVSHEFHEVDGRICKWENYRGTLASL
jgi:hypothetical protein